MFGLKKKNLHNRRKSVLFEAFFVMWTTQRFERYRDRSETRKFTFSFTLKCEKQESPVLNILSVLCCKWSCLHWPQTWIGELLVWFSIFYVQNKLGKTTLSFKRLLPSLCYQGSPVLVTLWLTGLNISWAKKTTCQGADQMFRYWHLDQQRSIFYHFLYPLFWSIQMMWKQRAYLQFYITLCSASQH